MRSRTSGDIPEDRQKDARRDEVAEDVESSLEADEVDLDENNLDATDDDRWDAFILDDDGEPLPEYGDFWFPD